MCSHRVVKFALFAAILFEAACVTEVSTSASALRDPTSWTDSPSSARDTGPQLRLHGPDTQARVPGAGLVGYYDMLAGIGLDYAIPPISSAGGTPITVDDPSGAALANLNVLFVTNPSNFGFGPEYFSRLSDIAAAVTSGMVLVIHDRTVSNAAGILPSGDSFGIFRDSGEREDINLRDRSTPVTNGLDDDSLDGGNASNHGFAQDTTLPARAKLLLTSTSASRVVTFCYPVVRGAVIYSTIPLDFYLQGLSGNLPLEERFGNYARNVVEYAIAGACSRQGPRPTPNLGD